MWPSFLAWVGAWAWAVQEPRYVCLASELGLADEVLDKEFEEVVSPVVIGGAEDMGSGSDEVLQLDHGSVARAGAANEPEVVVKKKGKGNSSPKKVAAVEKEKELDLMLQQVLEQL